MPNSLIEQIQNAMLAAFPRPSDPTLREFYQIMEYQLGWRDEQLASTNAYAGKLIRPTLAVLACRMFGGTVDQALPLAAAVQLIHDFSLIHDDIEDHSDQRRGRPTVWKLWGLEVGVNVGDGLFAVAHRSVYRLLDAGVSPTRTLAVLRGFEETILRICEGQHLDITGEGHFTITEERYLAMIRGKTAALLAAATGLGTQIATDDPATIAAMHAFGEALGLAFQMQDDLLDIWGDPQLTGKPYAADLLQRKMSLPVLHAFTHAGPDRMVIERIYSQDQLSSDDVQTLLSILDRTGSRDHVTKMVAAEHQRALDALQSIEPIDRDAHTTLQDLATSLVDRKW